MFGLSIKLYEECQKPIHPNFQWRCEDPRKHWIFSKHCCDILFPKALANPPLLTDQIKLYWHLYSAKGNYDLQFEKELRFFIGSSLLKAVTKKNLCLRYVILSEQLIKFDKYDYANRKYFLQRTIEIISSQSALEIVCIEGLKLTRAEGYKILSSLTKSCKFVKYLYLWRAFKRNEYALPKANEDHQNNPCLDNFIYQHHWLNAILYLRFIETIGVNYSYIASKSGHAILFLARHLKKHWKCLQLLCLEEELPGTLNEKGEKDSVAIPDHIWIEARKYSPFLKVHLVLIGVPQYDRHKKFLSPNIPVEAFVLSTDVKLLFQKPCMIDCTLKTVYLWYHTYLTSMHLNLYHHREFLDNHLRKILACLPKLKFFEFLGEVRDLVTISTMCCQIKIGTCVPNRVRLQIQKPLNMTTRFDDWLDKAHCILSVFESDFKKLNVIFEVEGYLT